jgi:hypothetical protein
VGKAKQPGPPRPVPALAPRVWFEASRFSSVHGPQAREEQVRERVRRLRDRESSVAVRTPPALRAEAFRRDREWVVRPEHRRPAQADRRDELRRLAVLDNHIFREKKKGP